MQKSRLAISLMTLAAAVYVAACGTPVDKGMYLKLPGNSDISFVDNLAIHPQLVMFVMASVQWTLESPDGHCSVGSTVDSAGTDSVTISDMYVEVAREDHILRLKVDTAIITGFLRDLAVRPLDAPTAMDSVAHYESHTRPRAISASTDLYDLEMDSLRFLPSRWTVQQHVDSVSIIIRYHITHHRTLPNKDHSQQCFDGCFTGYYRWVPKSMSVDSIVPLGCDSLSRAPFELNL